MHVSGIPSLIVRAMASFLDSLHGSNFLFVTGWWLSLIARYNLWPFIRQTVKWCKVTSFLIFASWFFVGSTLPPMVVAAAMVQVTDVSFDAVTLPILQRLQLPGLKELSLVLPLHWELQLPGWNFTWCLSATVRLHGVPRIWFDSCRECGQVHMRTVQIEASCSLIKKQTGWCKINAPEEQVTIVVCICRRFDFHKSGDAIPGPCFPGPWPGSLP